MLSVSVRVLQVIDSWFFVAFCELGLADVPRPSLVTDTYLRVRAARRFWTRLL